MRLDSPGKRILFVRNLSGMDRKDFYERFGIPVITLRSWEKSEKLKYKSVQRFVDAINKAGVYCTAAWVMEGKGTSPSLSELNEKSAIDIFGDDFDESVIDEFNLLQERYRNMVLEMVTDDAMCPFINIGDYVAGVLVNNISILDKSICITETTEGINYIRELVKSTDGDKYHLKALNSESEYQFIYNQSIKTAAEIIWVRRRPTVC